jgi:hypothetical protein
MSGDYSLRHPEFSATTSGSHGNGRDTVLSTDHNFPANIESETNHAHTATARQEPAADRNPAAVLARGQMNPGATVTLHFSRNCLKIR